MKLLICLLGILIGGLDIGLAIEYFVEKKYVRFGIFAMYSFSLIICIIKHIFEL